MGDGDPLRWGCVCRVYQTGSIRPGGRSVEHGGFWVVGTEPELGGLARGSLAVAG